MSSLAPLGKSDVLDAVTVSTPRARTLHPAAALAALLAIFVSLAFISGAFQAELSGETDEAAHYITGLMVRDYVLHGLPQNPVTYAANYYLHYPKVAFGHWPPFFYVVQAGWMMVFGDSPVAGILLVVVMTGVLAWLIFRVVRDEFGSAAAALACGTLFLLMPIVQKYGQMLMADMPVALAMVAAALAWARFMETERRRYAVYFALLASAGILTKGNAFALAFLPPFAILLCRRWSLLRNPSVWIAAGIVAAITLPWTLVTRDLVVPTMQHDFGLKYLREGGWFYFSQLFAVPGWTIIVFALIGIAAQVVVPFARRNLKPIWASLFAMVAAVQVFHMLAPAGLEVRYLLPSWAAFMAFLAAGVAWVVSLFPRSIPRWGGAAGVAAVIAAAFLASDFSVHRKRAFGYDEVGRALSDDPQFNGARRILCSSNADGEGLLISEIARREDGRPDRLVARGTQMFARMGWNGDRYEPLVQTVDDAKAVLHAIPVDVVVFDRTSRATSWPHDRLLLSALQAPEWTLAGVYPQHRTAATMPNARIEVYRWTGPPRQGPSRLRVEVNFPKPKIVLDLVGAKVAQ